MTGIDVYNNLDRRLHMPTEIHNKQKIIIYYAHNFETSLVRDVTFGLFTAKIDLCIVFTDH